MDIGVSASLLRARKQPGSQPLVIDPIRVGPEDAGRDEPHEHGLGRQWTTRQFRMELGSDEIGVHMTRQFEHLHDRLLRVAAREVQSGLLQSIDHVWLDLISMSEPLPDMIGFTVEEPGE